MSPWRATSVLALLLVLCARTSAAQYHDVTRIIPGPHVRPGSAFMRGVLAEATQYSPTISALVARIDASNVVAHVECAYAASLTLQGRTLFVVATRSVRYVRIQVECGLIRRELMAIVGHELQHTAEIAIAPDVVDARSFARMLQTIGYSACYRPQGQYETKAALLTADRVRAEMLGRPVSSDDSDSSGSVCNRKSRLTTLPTHCIC